jgi:hypothetical protein
MLLTGKNFKERALDKDISIDYIMQHYMKTKWIITFIQRKDKGEHWTLLDDAGRRMRNFVIRSKLSAFRETEGAEVNKLKTAWHGFQDFNFQGFFYQPTRHLKS